MRKRTLITLMHPVGLFLALTCSVPGLLAGELANVLLPQPAQTSENRGPEETEEGEAFLFKVKGTGTALRRTGRGSPPTIGDPFFVSPDARPGLLAPPSSKSDPTFFTPSSPFPGLHVPLRC